MADNTNPDNPRKLATACRIFRAGAIGHRFSRLLTPAEGNRLQAIIGGEFGGKFSDLRGRLHKVEPFSKRGVRGVTFWLRRFLTVGRPHA
jgi:hypothetical protein